MNQRISALRKASLDAIATISTERAELLTQFYSRPDTAQYPVPVQRAKAFAYLLQNKKICINPDELIVGERGPAPKATPTYPEICLHNSEDLEMLDSRPKIPYRNTEADRKVYSDKVFPFWKGKSMREKIFTHLPEEWKTAYESGVFTEFQEQRAPGHTVAGSKIYRKGMLDFIEEIKTARDKLDYFGDANALSRFEQLEAMEITAQAIIGFATRHSRELEQMAVSETDEKKRTKLELMAEICRKVPANAPETFHEALQYYWFIHVGVITELNPWDSFNPGRLDQHLYPFYEKQLAEGTMNRDSAKELLCAFWIKFNNHPAPPKMGVTAKESNTYTDFTLINVGGVKPDGSDATNELSFLILEVIEEMRLLQPGSMVQLSKKNPDALLRRALKIVKTGFGQPSIFNTDSLIQEMVRQGKDIIDARNGGCSGCVETGAFGTEAYFLTGYFNFAKILELTLFNGKDPVSNKLIGIQTGLPDSFHSFDDFFAAFAKQLNFFIDIKIKGNNIIESLYARYMPAPFLSLIIDDCITNGKDYNAGGARYNTSYIQGVGLGSCTDALTAIRYQVFDRKRISLPDFLKVLNENYSNYDDLRAELLHNTPKYGNDDEYADSVMQRLFEVFYNAVDSRPTVRGGNYRINLLPTTSHVYFGSKTGALPDGRKSGTPLSEGISPVQGSDRKGPSAVIKSAARIDHLRTGGTLLNQKFTPSLLETESGMNGVLHLVRSYFKLDGHHIQFNVVSAETLRKAKAEPEKYRNLIVRVAGYSDYFVDLSEELQDEIIRRSEHGS